VLAYHVPVACFFSIRFFFTHVAHYAGKNHLVFQHSLIDCKAHWEFFSILSFASKIPGFSQNPANADFLVPGNVFQVLCADVCWHQALYTFPDYFVF